MNCRTALECMLEADPAELGGAGRSVLSHHIAGCLRCRVAADRVLAQHAGLERMFVAASPESTTRAIEAAMRAAVRPRRRWPIAIPLAAAAVLALVARFEGVRIDPSTDPGPGATGTSNVTEPPSLPAVNAPDGRDVAVFRTADPNITVVWYLRNEAIR